MSSTVYFRCALTSFTLLLLFFLGGILETANLFASALADLARCIIL